MKKIQDDYQKCISDAEIRFQEFIASEDVEMSSPEYLSVAGRKAWHTLAEKYGMYSISSGEGMSRFVVVSKHPIRLNGKPLLMTPTAQRNFRDHFDLKINLCDPEDFEYYVDLYGAREQLNLILAAIAEFKNEQEWINHINIIKVRIWTHIRSTDAYNRFITADLTEYQKETDRIKAKFNFKDAYLEKENSGKTFVSIDLRSANYNSMYWFAKEMFMINGNQTETWQSFVSQFSDDYPASAKFVTQSKLFRQKIFWELEKKRQVLIYEYLIAKVAEMLPFPIKNAYHVGDEILFEIDEGYDEQIKQFEKMLDLRYYRVRVFKLHQVAKNKGWLVRKFCDTNTFDIKCCTTFEYTIIWKKINNLPIDQRDLKIKWNHNTKQWNQIDLNEIQWLEF